MLRELVSNTIVHGVGREPQSWAHGLGLGGIRKRVKLLGGEVRWAENGTQGIVCEVRIPGLVAPT